MTTELTTLSDIEDALGYYEERAAIMEFEGGMPRPMAELKAAESQGYLNQEALIFTLRKRKDEIEYEQNLEKTA